jgi:hypothetical protein
MQLSCVAESPDASRLSIADHSGSITMVSLAPGRVLPRPETIIGGR